MPPDGDALALDSDVDAWIEAFHRLKKWKRAPNPLRQGGKLRKSPAKTFERRLEQVRNDIGADAIEARIDAATDEARKLRGDLDAAGDDDERARIEDEIARLQEQIVGDRTELELAERIAQRIHRLAAAEGDLGRVKSDTMHTIADLQAQVAAGAVDPATLDQGRVAEFRALHVEVQKRVDNARAEIMTFRRDTPKGPRTEKIAVINATEYRILFGMLEQSILELQLGKLDDAFATERAAADLLVSYRNARTGADPIAQKAVLVPELDQPMHAAGSRIEELAGRGYATAVAALKSRLDTLGDTLRQGLADGETDLADQHIDAARALEADARAAYDAWLRIERLFAEARADIATMRGNGHVHRPRRADAKIAAYKPGDSMEAALAGAEAIRAYAAEKLAETRKDDLRREGMSDVELRAQLDDAKARFTALLKTRKDGTPKTRKDDETGQEKLVPASRKLPEGAVAEIALQIEAAEQLIASGSIDALRMAAGYFDGVETFIGAIETDPGVYRTLAKGFDALDAKLGKIEKSHGLYEPGERLDLKAEVADLRAGHLTRPQADVAEDTKALSDRIDAFREKVEGLRARKRRLATIADEREKTLDSIGALLAARKTTRDDENPFDGYHGTYSERLRTLRGKIADRSERSLNEAAQIIVEMGNLNGILDAMKRQADGAALPGEEMTAVYDFVADARQGQKAHDDNQAKKKDFNTRRSEVKKAIAKAIERTEKLKGDTTELEGLENERTALVGETRDSGQYIAGLAKMEALLTRAQRLGNDAKAAAAILDTDLGSAAQACAQSVRDFRDHVAGFVAGVVAPAGQTDGGNQLDDPALYDRAKIEAAMDAIVKAMPDAIIDRLGSNATILVSRSATPEARKTARKEALLAVRALMGTFDGFDPLAVFRSHPFADASAAALESARRALPRLEVRFLKVSI